MAKYTPEDVQKIAERLKGARDRERPAHFLIGAGCSISAGIPGAADLVKRIHSDYPAHCSDLMSESRGSYGACMALLSLNERRDLIKPYLEAAKINWGTIAIAQLIARNFIGRVLTANFDLVLENACGLLGLQPAVYDFGVAPANDPEMIVSPSIIHLHGQSYGLVLLNTDEETTKHREKLRPVLANSLRNAPLVVLGYSGSADGIFQTLFDEFEGRERFYWTSYEEEPQPHVQPFLERNHFQFVGGADFDRFMIELAQSLGCWPPQLFSNPLAHLLDELRPIVSYPVSDSTSAIDLLGGLRRRLATMQHSLAEDGHIGIFREMYMRGKYQELVDLFLSLPDRGAASSEENEMAASSMHQLGVLKYHKAVGSNEETAAALLKEASDYYNRALEIDPSMVDAVMGLGNVLGWQLRGAAGNQADKLFDAANEKFKAALAIDPKSDAVLYNWGSLLSLYSTKTDDDRRQLLLNEVREKLSEGLKLNPKKTYNAACVAALLGDEEACRQHLEVGLEHGTLPRPDWLMADTDLHSVRDKPWFEQLIERLKTKSRKRRQ